MPAPGWRHMLAQAPPSQQELKQLEGAGARVQKARAQRRVGHIQGLPIVQRCTGSA
eukprot:CAMPEP_0175640794 /NCGR_PEP_ID=MMETSP0097-20121207/4430_1 /TAXON_ID=311494 /ORGANISM="Alexandrium monilatum, Strain CCMP3105" /LENGTH=55 /DNA_ID=CAMNT_0016946553 /DNA_START=235 /DNA_END=399 /DNA_ORIENTATION=+